MKKSNLIFATLFFIAILIGTAIDSCSPKIASVSGTAETPTVSYSNNVACISGKASATVKTEGLAEMLKHGYTLNYGTSQVQIRVQELTADSSVIVVDYSGCVKVK
jgi:hypothetical protein